MLAGSWDVGVGLVWSNSSKWLIARLEVVVLCTLRQRASKVEYGTRDWVAEWQSYQDSKQCSEE
jgi:hypothetical protein